MSWVALCYQRVCRAKDAVCFYHPVSSVDWLASGWCVCVCVCVCLCVCVCVCLCLCVCCSRGDGGGGLARDSADEGILGRPQEDGRRVQAKVLWSSKHQVSTVELSFCSSSKQNKQTQQKRLQHTSLSSVQSSQLTVAAVQGRIKMKLKKNEICPDLFLVRLSKKTFIEIVQLTVYL